jgi:excinuclease ABC subunit A
VVVELNKAPKLAKTRAHTIELVVDRLRLPEQEDQEGRTAFLKRLSDSVETTLRAGSGLLVADLGQDHDLILSEQNACAVCNLSFAELSPQLFSWYSPGSRPRLAGSRPFALPNGWGAALVWRITQEER